MTEYEREKIIEYVSECISVYAVTHSNLRKQDLTKRTNSAQNLASALAELIKANDGHSARIGLRQLAQEAGISQRTVDRHLKLIVKDLRLEPEAVVGDLIFDILGHSPFQDAIVHWNRDKMRNGNVFVCQARGSFNGLVKSEYRLCDELQALFGWVSHADEKATEATQLDVASIDVEIASESLKDEKTEHAGHVQPCAASMHDVEVMPV